MERIPDETLDRNVTGVNLMPGTLRDQLGEERTLLVFLRHFGCIFCRETIGELRGLSDTRDDYPSVLFFSQASPTEGRAFLRRYWPTARVVSDPELKMYDAFGIKRGGPIKMFGPQVFRAKRRAQAAGYEMGDERSGDMFRMPGVFLVEEDRILWTHVFKHAADHPEFGRVDELAAG